jgi:DNA invertase Pin-like site-specific DNA recombinase
MLAAIAEFERDLIRDRVLAGLQRARVKGMRSGKAIGRPRLHHVTAEAVQALMTGENLSLRATARRLRVHHSAVTRVLALAGANLSRNGLDKTPRNC